MYIWYTVCPNKLRCFSKKIRIFATIINKVMIYDINTK